MSVESATYISQLDATLPSATDLKSEGDDHLRLLKACLKAQFTGLGASAVTASASDLNATTGRSADIAAIAGAATTGASIKVTTQTATDNTTNAANTAMVQAAILASSGISASLPAQTGNSGKYLTTNGSAASWGTVTVVGTGGTTSTASITLTASSPAAMTVTPANPGLYVTLPDATTCTKADNLYAVYNAGDYDYGVKDSAGTQLGWIRARTGAMIGLADNSTAAGVWAYYGLEKVGVTGVYLGTTTVVAGSIQRIALDATRTLLIFNTTGYAIVFNHTTGAFGSPALIRATFSGMIGVLSATDQVLVVSCDSTTALEAVTLTIATNTITVNSGTKATATLAGNYSSFGQLIAVGASFVVSYGRATTTSAIRALTVSGTTPTIGSEGTVSNPSTTPPTIFATGSVVRLLSITVSVLYCRPYTVSGVTLTLGTETNVATTAVGFRAFVNGNGNIIAQYVNTTHYATIFKLTGTTEAASSVSLSAVAPTSDSVVTKADANSISASKTLFICANSTNFQANILTDTAGTASVGTELQITLGGAPAPICVPLTGSTQRVIISNTASSSLNGYILLDCSGASPAYTSGIRFTAPAPTNYLYGNGVPSSLIGVKAPQLLVAGSSAYLASGQSGLAGDLRYTDNSIVSLKPAFLIANSGTSVATSGAANESWVCYGGVLNRVEAAA